VSCCRLPSPAKATDAWFHKSRILSRRQSREQGGMSRTACAASMTHSTAILSLSIFSRTFSHPDYDPNNTSSEYSFRVLGVDFEIVLVSLCFYGLVPFTRYAYIASDLWVGCPRRSLLAFERSFNL
jgi:hypothetical protein